MAVQVDGQGNGGFQRLYQFARVVGRQQTRHVLDRQRVAAHGFQFFGHLHEIGNVMHRAGGVADGTLGCLAGLFDRIDGNLQIAQVVHGVENAEHIHAVVSGFLYECAYHVVGIVTVAEQVLPAQQHLDAGVGQCLAQALEAIPRVFAQETHAGVERGATPGFERPETDIVEFLADRQHVLGAHTGCDQGLVAVT